MSDKANTPEAKWSGRNADKDRLRHEIWAILEEQSASIGSPWSHIPNFVGADAAASKLAELSIWKDAHIVKCNPDMAQSPVRLRALQEGKLVYMPIPALVEDLPFVLLDPNTLRANGAPFEEAALHTKAVELGKKVGFRDMQPIDLVVTGCVAVTRNGGRTGKGAGFADIELGIMREFGLIKLDTPIVTTVHPLQVVDDDRVVMQSHDSALHWIITPDEVIETHSPYPQPRGVDWDAVQPDQFRDIPFLSELRNQLQK
jgi:5-formyltetrahydrofolate cyclo-ligase